MKRFLKILSIPVGLIVLYAIFFLCIEFLYILTPSKGAMIDPKKNVHSAILVIDVQDMFTNPDYEKKAKELKADVFMDNINLAIKRLGNTETIYIRQEFAKNSLLSLLIPFFPVEGEPRTAINKTVYKANSKIFTKTRGDAFWNPSLQEYLDSKRVGTLYITGLAAEACVDRTIQGACSRGYRVYVLPEAVLSMNGGAPDRERRAKYESYGAKNIALNDLK